MRKDKIIIRLQWLVSRGIYKSYLILFVRTNEKKKNKKGQTKESMRSSHSSIIHMPLCMSICLCNLIYSPIDIQ